MEPARTFKRRAEDWRRIFAHKPWCGPISEPISSKPFWRVS